LTRRAKTEGFRAAEPGRSTERRDRGKPKRSGGLGRSPEREASQSLLPAAASARARLPPDAQTPLLAPEGKR
jgi:hypothetical protein